jgi:hypothetical protein
MEKRFVKPSREGLLIRFPNNSSRILKQEREEVEWNTFWQRRLIANEIVLSSPSVAEEEPQGEKKRRRQ